jgi:hypothetical protein
MPVCAAGKGVHHRGIGEAVDPPFGIGAQHDRIRDIERERAAGKSMLGPGEGHEIF